MEIFAKTEKMNNLMCFKFVSFQCTACLLKKDFLTFQHPISHNFLSIFYIVFLFINCNLYFNTFFKQLF